ncbi:hypothetical protein G7047_29245 [Diaphorobacter sp. HDW4A]|uniref:hypothetical protein n=1 Tax=Diaphorobacter sp. HDW4A TaxID=2714924 RepID=UPI0014088F38|nr:hypothetical protein [Diaphorobacter sp. HDW4A]QIL83568.1 hypothetical protein G7047_29245 [Diaphorobacter sp. HDW4A]
MKQLLVLAGALRRTYVPLQMGQTIKDRNYSQQQTKANQRQQGQPVPETQPH